MNRKWLGVLCACAFAASASPAQAAASPPNLTPGQNLIVNELTYDGKVLVDTPTPLSAIQDPFVRSYVVASVSASIQKQDGAIAGCAGSVDLRRSGCTVKAVVSISRSNDEKDWTVKKEKSFTATKQGMTTSSFIYAMTHGHYYKTTITADTYDENGMYRDTMSVSSVTLYY